ncbi:MAG: hypothetical protein LBE92_12285 [Chryseobacterium sp.]|jgi:hypothetical protein|uniref:hypothetical protein n=1 Tax=Chryseobacterium sp. TaxID=1871047 RepID=UPI002832186A|nr:hypothetical protein [Chryseobacterium sp.]MDR2236894.1 hypothetical protein [Chryseobacterium sp.]
MKKDMSVKGKKLNKKELRMITAGGVRCMISKRCQYYGPGCTEPECQPPIPIDIEPLDWGGIV